MRMKHENYSLRQILFKTFFLVVYLFLALDSPVEIYCQILANKKLYYIKIAKYTIEITKLKWNIFTRYFTHKFYKTEKKNIWLY